MGGGEVVWGGGVGRWWALWYSISGRRHKGEGEGVVLSGRREDRTMRVKG